jgi:23S rRNA (uridine2552-2'-O)-methyltransferase
MARSKSSARWLREHNEDEYVLRAKAEGYRSRAVYKLQELDNKYTLFRGGMQVVDLGSAPGGWSQYAAHKVGHSGRVIASDILSMDSIAGVEFIQGDFQEPEVLQALLDLLGAQRADLVLSDMAPNMSGVDAVDIPRAMYLVELAHQLAVEILRKNGAFVSKLFQGQGSDEWLRRLRQDFARVVVRKPAASRPRSREVYVLASGFKGR